MITSSLPEITTRRQVTGGSYTSQVRVALTLWFLAWSFVALPWRSFQPEPSFERVQTTPFTDGSARAHILNVVAFVPLGGIGARLVWSPATIVGIGASTSIATEVLQLFSSRRYPSVTDIILNTTGVAIGLLFASAFLRGRQRPATD